LRQPSSVDRPKLSPYRAALVSVDPALTPASPDQLRAILGRLRLHYGMPDLTPQQYTLFWQDYADDLAHVPADVLEQAAIGWRRKVPAEKYFPKPADLLTIIRSQRVFEERARRAALKVEAQRRDADPAPPTPEEKAAAVKLMAGLKERMAAMRPMPRGGVRAPDRLEEQSAKPTEAEIRDFERRKQAVIEEARAAGMIE
jgi:hypothetical protein